LNRTADLLKKDEAFLQEKTGRIMARVLVPQGTGVWFSRSALKKLPPSILSRLLQKALFRVKGDLRLIGSVHLHSLMNVIYGPSLRGRTPLPGGMEASWELDRMVFRPTVSIAPSPLNFLALVKEPGTVYFREIGAEISFEQVPVDPRTDRKTMNKRQVLVDWEKIQWPVAVRNVKAGDRFQPLGLRGSKKVTRFLMDRKIPRSQRDRIPIVFSGGKIVWIAGLEIGESFALREQSRQALRLKLRRA